MVSQRLHSYPARLIVGLIGVLANITGGHASAADTQSASVRVEGNHLIDAAGKVLQLRGVNVSGLEFVPMQGWSPDNPWGGQTGDATPNWKTIKSWQTNVVRIPLNEAPWLGYTCKDAGGALHKPDAGGRYKSAVADAVSGATAAGFYVILDLHWTAPGKFCPLGQNAMADADNSITFWTQVATQFKRYPNVMFELFNEPFVGSSSAQAADWQTIMAGGPQTDYVSGGKPYKANYSWNTAGMQQMLDAVRATGATNVVLVGAPSWCQDLSRWAATRPNDPLHQIGAVWHAYPNSGTLGDPQAALPKFGAQAYPWVQGVLDAGYPVVITEFGDHAAAGTKGAPFASNLLPWADARNVSYLGWAWDTWGNGDNVLIKNAAGEPSDGYGQYYKAHLACVAGGAANCH